MPHTGRSGPNFDVLQNACVAAENRADNIAEAHEGDHEAPWALSDEMMDAMERNAIGALGRGEPVLMRGTEREVKEARGDEDVIVGADGGRDDVLALLGARAPGPGCAQAALCAARLSSLGELGVDTGHGSSQAESSPGIFGGDGFSKTANDVVCLGGTT
ncbi:unnamed protein product [Ilex paraguariensis]|uniref:Uncharacterized protein n=1 Tax=Ilex paraguariensis TaxID=185542 RepID=A0ABC8TGR1_9AQUA